MHTNPETLALLALGEQAGTAEERSHVAGCATCSAEVSDLAHLAGVGRATTSTDTLSTPSPEVWERIRADLGFTAAATSNGQAATEGVADDRADVVELASRPRRASAGRRVLSLAAAAALALIVGIGVGVAWDRLRGGEEDRTVATAPLQAQPRWAGASGEAELQVDERGRRWLVVNVANPPPVAAPPQVWVRSETVPAAMINLGQFYESGQRFRVDNINLQEFPLVDVSDEPDANPRHSGNTILLGKLTV